MAFLKTISCGTILTSSVDVNGNTKIKTSQPMQNLEIGQPTKFTNQGQTSYLKQTCC